jgi:hypothetical protein
MDKMMGMCSEMLSTIQKTNALAVAATSEPQRAFAEWLHGIE